MEKSFQLLLVVLNVIIVSPQSEKDSCWLLVVSGADINNGIILMLP